MDRGNETLFNRIERLERANRRMRILGLALLAATFTLGAASSGKFSPVLRTQRLQIVDDKGNVRADLGLFDPVEPNPALLLYDGNGVLRTFNGIAHPFEPLTGFVTWDGHGVVRSATGSTPLESGSWAFDNQGFTRSGFDVNYQENFTGFFTNDASGKNRVALGTPTSGDGWVTLNLNDANQQTRAQLITYDNGAGSWAEAAYLLDQDGVYRSGLQVDNPCCGNGLGSDSLFFFTPKPADPNQSPELTGYFYSGPANAGAGTYVTEDGAGSITGHLP